MGRGSESSAYKGKRFFAAIKGAKEGEKVHFELSSKAGKDEPIKKEGDEPSLSGIITGAEHRIWEYKGEPKDSVVLIIQDSAAGAEGETYKLEMSMSSIARSIIKSLLSVTSFFEEIKISLYTNKKGYASVFVSQGVDANGKDVACPWAISLEDEAKYITKETKKAKDAKGKVVDKSVNNYMELDEYLLNRFKDEIIPKVMGKKAAASAPSSDEPSPNGDDLPF